MLILILITAVLYSAPSRKSTQERSQPNLGQTMLPKPWHRLTLHLLTREHTREHQWAIVSEGLAQGPVVTAQGSLCNQFIKVN